MHADAEPPWKRALGEKVRGLRGARGLSQRELADRAGLSLRFVAEVEGGKANPSLGSIVELAQALSVSVVSLLSFFDPGADAGGQRQVIALLGLRGAGKSTVGKRVAKALERELVELDREIEREAGMSLAELFALHGETHYRTLEGRVLARLFERGQPLVVATGGGIVTHPESFALLKQRAMTVWLKATPQEHWERVLRQGDDRPMRKRSQARAELEALFVERAPLYQQADLVVDTSKNEADQAARMIVERVERGAEVERIGASTPPPSRGASS